MMYVIKNGELQHSGVKGMRWGVRRYQNRDGTLTAAGKKRYAKEAARLKDEEKRVKNAESTKAKIAKLNSKRDELEERKKALNAEPEKKKDQANVEPESEPKAKRVKDMSDDELASAIRRMELEKRYNDLNPKKVSLGKKIVRDVIAPAATQAGKNLLQDALIKKGKKYLGLTDAPDPTSALKKEVEKLNLQKQYKDLTDTENIELKNKVYKMAMEKQLKTLEDERKKREEENK